MVRTAPREGWKEQEKPLAGILVREEGHGLDDGRERLRRALSVLRNSESAGVPPFPSQAPAVFLLRRPLLRSRLPSEFLLNRLHHEVHESDVVRHAVQLQAPSCSLSPAEDKRRKQNHEQPERN